MASTIAPVRFLMLCLLAGSTAHLGFIAPGRDAAIEMLTAKGAPVLQSGGWDAPSGQGRFAFLDTELHGGVTLELIWNKQRNP